MTNLLAMPLVSMSVITGTNEDWVDSIKFTVDDGSADFPQLDLTGIRFDLEVRHLPPDNEVVIRASTEDGTLAIGIPPDYGFLLINVSHEQMKHVREGTYFGDITGIDEFSVRRCIVLDVTIQLGITRP